MTTSDLERAIEAHFGVVPDEVQQAIDALKTEPQGKWRGDEEEARDMWTEPSGYTIGDTGGPIEEEVLDLIRRAKAEGRREGLEEAATVCEESGRSYRAAAPLIAGQLDVDVAPLVRETATLAKEIRALKVSDD